MIFKSPNLSWWSGGTLLENLKQLETPTRPSSRSLRIPIQIVYHKKGLGSLPCGRICRGALKQDAEVIFVPGNEVAKVSKIKMYRKEYTEGFPGNNIIIEPDRSIRISPGQVCGEKGGDPPRLCSRISCEMIILNNFEGKIKAGFAAILCYHTSHVR